MLIIVQVPKSTCTAVGYIIFLETKRTAPGAVLERGDRAASPAAQAPHQPAKGPQHVRKKSVPQHEYRQRKSLQNISAFRGPSVVVIVVVADSMRKTQQYRGREVHEQLARSQSAVE